MLMRTTDYYDFEVDNSIKKLSTYIEPALTVFLGLVVLFLALAVFLPWWNIASLFKKMMKRRRNAEWGTRNAEWGIKTPNSELRTPNSELNAPNSKGMTFIELLAALVIIGILSAIVISRLDLAFTSSRASVDGAAYMIASDIRYAQEFAMANRVLKTVTFNAGSSVYTFSSNPASLSDKLSDSQNQIFHYSFSNSELITPNYELITPNYHIFTFPV